MKFGALAALMMGLPLIGLLLAGAAQAQSVYRCNDNGRIVFSDKPCPGGEVVDTRPATGSKGAAPAPAPSTAPSATPSPAPSTAAPRPAAPAAGAGGVAPGVGYATREQACAGGNARACDEIACLRDERDACERIGGGLRGSGWYEASRHRETHRGKNDAGQTTLRRVLVLTIKCTGNPPRGGDIVIGRGNNIALRSGSTQYSSVDTAAAALCKR
jgi:hypothetical protein